MSKTNCYHCGLEVGQQEQIPYDGQVFCCTGCKTVYEIFSAGGLQKYYELGVNPGAQPGSQQSQFDYLENEVIVKKLLEFSESATQITSLHIPHIHCSSCIWILENLSKLNPGIISSQVNFGRKSVRIVFNQEQVSLKEVAQLLSSIGYEPNINLEQFDKKATNTDRSLIYKLGVAFFCFGNIMLLSFPEYFEVEEYWLDQYKGFFRLLIFLLALPSFLYSASGYYIAAWYALKNKLLNIEVPIALGIIVMFIRSVFDMWLDHGPGFFDSLTALVFFMLLGKMFQSKTYDYLNFERDYKSYFPIAVTRLKDGSEENVPVYQVEPGDRLLLRNKELIPADAILMSASASIDYSFVTGEAIPVEKISGDTLFAGGRQMGSPIEVEVIRAVSQSYLTSLWSQQEEKSKPKTQLGITNRLSQYFTPILLLIAVIGWSYWMFFDTHIAFNVFTAVLIVACPCALALTAPFTLGNILRILGRHKFYVRDAAALERISQIDTIVFDKTGTITNSKMADINYEGKLLSPENLLAVKQVLRASNHPLSRMLYQSIEGESNQSVTEFSETTGGGIQGVIAGQLLKIGSATFVGIEKDNSLQTQVHISIDNEYFGKYLFKNRYRNGMKSLFERLAKSCKIHLLSGDNQGEQQHLQEILPLNTPMSFNKKPDQKRDYVVELQNENRVVMMVGDGLNDAGALRQSDVGVAVSENVNLFSPACDAIIDAEVLDQLDKFISLSKKAIVVIKWSFGLSLLYNVVGLAFALTGKLDPLVAAIIMPLSTVTIVSFTTLGGNYFANRLKIKSVKSEE